MLFLARLALRGVTFIVAKLFWRSLMVWCVRWCLRAVVRGFAAGARSALRRLTSWWARKRR